MSESDSNFLSTIRHVSILDRFVFLIKMVLYFPFGIAFIGIALFPTPYNEPPTFHKIFLVLIGVGGILSSIKCCREVLRINRKLNILKDGMEYHGFFGKRHIAWRDIQEYHFVNWKFGFNYLVLKLVNKERKVVLNVSALTISENLLRELISLHIMAANGI
jgi:hypothetical protein